MKSPLVAALTLLLGTSLLAPALDLRYPPTPADKQALIAMGWSAARDSLSEKLEAGYLPGLAGRAGSTGMTGYRQWLALWKWFDLLSRTETEETVNLLRQYLFVRPGHDKPLFFPPGHKVEEMDVPVSREQAASLLEDPKIRSEILGVLLPPGIPDPKDQPVADRFEKSLLESWILDAAFSEAFFQILTPADYAPGVLWNLKEIHAANPQAIKMYPSLALAITVVFDSKLPANWPHHQVNRDLLPLAEVAPASWFARWVESAESKDLLVDLKTTKAGLLKFVVDAPLSESEYKWALKNARFPRTDFSKAFSAVKYDDSRISSRQFVWDRGEYTLANIFSRGGICVDQAYFATIAGKARGIPTLYFSGQGADGGHAWFGYLKSNERWEMDAGRYENQNYAVGEAMDPQSWRPISDHELAGISEGFRDKAAFAASRDDILMASLFEQRGNSALAAKAFESAVAVCPQSPETWAARQSFLERTAAAPSQRKLFHEAALKQFQNRKDLKVRHQSALAAIAREQGDAATADAIERQIVTQNRSTRADLSVNAAARQLTSLLDQNKIPEAFTEYRRMLTSLKKTGGGNFFYDIVVPFAETLNAAGESAKAEEAVEIAQKALDPETGSILDHEFRELRMRLKSKD
jgi:tetratricopeptide (TPR) repeat protein